MKFFKDKLTYFSVLTIAGLFAAQIYAAPGDKTEVGSVSSPRHKRLSSATLDYNRITTNKPTLGTAAAKNIPAAGNASATEVVYGTDSRLTDPRTPTAHNHAESEVTNLTTDLASKVTANGAITGSTKTKITYDSKGLVTAGADVIKADIGLGNVDDTSDLNKPISTATQTALDAKQNTLVSGTNIKSINGSSILGTGDLTVSSDQFPGMTKTLTLDDPGTDTKFPTEKAIRSAINLSLPAVNDPHSSAANGAIADGSWHPLTNSQPGYFTDFSDGFNNGFTAEGATISMVSGKLRVTSSGNDPILRTDPLELNGAKYRYIKIRFARIAGSGWDGTIFFRSEDTGESGSYSKSLGADPTIGQGSNYVEVTVDMSTIGGTPAGWLNSSNIRSVRFDLGSTASDVFDIDYIRIYDPDDSRPTSYTLAEAQAKWPYLTDTRRPEGTHILTAQNLSQYSVDWCTLQNMLYQYSSGIVLISKGKHTIERTLTVPTKTNIEGYGPESVIQPRISQSAWTGTKRLITLDPTPVNNMFNKVTFRENPYPQIWDDCISVGDPYTCCSGAGTGPSCDGNTGQFIGVYAPTGSNNVTIFESRLDGLYTGVQLDGSFNNTYIRDNFFRSVSNSEVYLNGSASYSSENNNIISNTFYHPYKHGAGYAVKVADNSVIYRLNVKNNNVVYKNLLYFYAPTGKNLCKGMFSDISNNNVLGSNVVAGGSGLYFVTADECYSVTINNNHIWMGNDKASIAIGGQGQWNLWGNSGSDWHQTCYLSIEALPGSVEFGGMNYATTTGTDFAAVCTPLTRAGTNEFASVANPDNMMNTIRLTGINTITGRSVLKYNSQVETGSFTSTNITVDGEGANRILAPQYALTHTIPPDIGTVIDNFGTSMVPYLPRSGNSPVGKTITYVNNSAVDVTISKQTSGYVDYFYNQSGSEITTFVIPARNTVVFTKVTLGGSNPGWKVTAVTPFVAAAGTWNTSGNNYSSGMLTVGANSLSTNGDLVVATEGTTADRGIASSQFGAVTSGALIRGLKARGTRLSPSAYSSGDTIVGFQGYGYNGPTNKYVVGGGMNLTSTTHPGDVNYGGAADWVWWLADGANNYAEKMRLKSTGFLGVGTVSPISELQVASSAVVANRGITSSFHANSAAGALFAGHKSRGTLTSPVVTNSGDYLTALAGRGYVGATNQYQGSGSISLRTTAAPTGDNAWGPAAEWIVNLSDGTKAEEEKMRITNTGNIGIGTPYPTVMAEILNNTTGGNGTHTITGKLTSTAAASSALSVGGAGVGVYHIRKITGISVTASTDTFSVASHPFVDGDAITFTNVGTLGGGLSAFAQQYFIINSAPTSFKVSLTKGGTALDITADGTGMEAMFIPQDKHRLGFFTFGGMDGVISRHPVMLKGYADGAWVSDGANTSQQYPGGFIIETTPSGAAPTRTERFRIAGNGNTTFGDMVTPVVGNTMITTYGSTAHLYTVKAGSNLAHGEVVQPDANNDDAVVQAAIDSYNPIGVVYGDSAGNTTCDATSADKLCWIVTEGRADVLMKNSTACTRAYYLYVSDTAGRANCGNDPSLTTHNRELGHALTATAGGTNVTVRGQLHFN